MGTQVQLFSDGSQLPDYIGSGNVNVITKSLMGGSGKGQKKISIRGKVWRVMSGGQEIASREESTLKVVIVNASEKNGRVFYKDAYVEGSTKSPDCWSSDDRMPDKKVVDPQSDRCDTCPQNVKGSGRNESKACRYSRRIAVVLENDIGGPIYQLIVPGASIFGEAEERLMPLQTYANHLGAYGTNVNDVVTEMRFDKKSSVPKLFFTAVRPLSREELAVSYAQTEHPDALAAISMDIIPNESREAAATQTPQPAIEAPKVIVQEPVKPAKANPFTASKKVVEEPVKREKPKSELPPEKKNVVNAILDEFDD